MKKPTEQLKTISQKEVNKIFGNVLDNLKHVTKIELADQLTKISIENEKLKDELHATATAMAELRKNTRHKGYVEVPVEELGDVIDDVKSIRMDIENIVLDRVEKSTKERLLMQDMRAIERIHSFCIGRANASEVA